MTSLTYFWKTPPTSDLEANLDLMLLELHVLFTACCVAFRIRDLNHTQWDGIGGGAL